RSYRKHNAARPDQSNGGSGETKALRKQLEEEKLKNELLEEILRLSEEQAGIDFRKKFGSRR
ncbi:MAG: hypothetical protein ABI203_11015, partial [Mucilaginibacter sp.]